MCTFFPAVATLVLAGAPLTFDDGEFLGWTQDGNVTVWVTARKVTWGDSPHFAKVAVTRDQLAAHEEEFELEVGPIDGKGERKPGPDVAKFDAWKAKHPLVKISTLEGVKTSVLVNGKAATTYGGTGKAEKVELVTEKNGVRQVEHSMLAEYEGKKVRPTSATVFLDPTGRRAAFVLSSEASGGQPRSAELVEVTVGPRVMLYTANANQDSARERIEKAGFPVVGWDEGKPRTGTTVTAAAALLPIAQKLAAALGGTAVAGKVNPQLGDLAVAIGP